MKRVGFSAAFAAALAGILGGTVILGLHQDSQHRPQAAEHWSLIWHDEFEGAAGATLDPAKWAFDLGNGGSNRGWGNHELEEYTGDLGNVFQDGSGHLVIRALRTPDRRYTSGRIKTQGKFSFVYGKVEARIKIPYAKGVWPAFWMLADTYPRTPWPESGEIDIAENFGEASGDRSTNHGTLHGPGFAGVGMSGVYRTPDGSALADDFHIYSAEWAPGSLEFFVDDISYFKVKAADLPPHCRWVFDDVAFFILLDLAVGGSPAPVRYPDADTPFPQDLIVDYVRVYQRKN